MVERLAGFERALERVRLQAASGGGVRRAEGGATHLTVEGVDLHLPDGQPLMANVNLSLLRGDTVLLGGASGSGKSTLVRAIAGIWPFGRGEVRVPLDARVLFLPQRPYLPIGTLRDVVSYPMPAGGIDDAALREALEAVGLAELAGRLDEATTWALQLSPGEQQRIAFARVLVQKPDWLFLDEATSAVDEATEADLYRLVRERLAKTTVFSIGHRATLRPFHARLLVVQPAGAAPRQSWRCPPRPTVDRGTVRSGPTRERRNPGSCALLRAFGRGGLTRSAGRRGARLQRQLPQHGPEHCSGVQILAREVAAPARMALPVGVDLIDRCGGLLHGAHGEEPAPTWQMAAEARILHDDRSAAWPGTRRCAR